MTRPGHLRELPAGVPRFTGRADMLAALTEVLERSRAECPGTPVISAISGTAEAIRGFLDALGVAARTSRPDLAGSPPDPGRPARPERRPDPRLALPAPCRLRTGPPENRAA
ncbi:MAG TPA: hypothetical protein VFQ68_32515 [Streptosporangiaceae bacterium]|nr:hypothetical protein [Streptosporangiaceae bacterium]